MRGFPLSAVKAGITRLRDKGGANPESLYDLLNGWVNAARAMVIRPGTTHIHTIPAGTKGLMAYQGKFLVFSHEEVVMTDSRFVCKILRHPTNPDATLAFIAFANEYMGVPYVIARFSDGAIVDYWLEDLPEWEEDTQYNVGDRVIPTTENGYCYKAKRLGSPYPVWVARTPRAVGDKVEPTVYNGFYYEVVAVEGDNPTSGDTEPTWPTIAEALVYEDTDGSTFTYETEVGGDGDTATNPGNGAVGSGNYTNPGGNMPETSQR